MKRKKILIIVLSLFIIFLGFTGLIISKNYNEQITYEWVEEKQSSIGQYRLFINNSKGKHIDGKIRITYLNGKSEVVEISSDGELYVKNIIKKVENPRKK